MSAPQQPRPRRPVPDADELERVATPGTVRRAPRYRSFVLVGVLLGVLAAVLVVALVPRAEGTVLPLIGAGPGVVLGFLALGACLVGALLGGVVAVLLDRRSGR